MVRQVVNHSKAHWVDVPLCGEKRWKRADNVAEVTCKRCLLVEARLGCPHTQEME